ncbi:MAG: hypothetical protein WBM35_16845 [Candidatus Electrothrix sp.]
MLMAFCPPLGMAGNVFASPVDQLAAIDVGPLRARASLRLQRYSPCCTIVEKEHIRGEYGYCS